MGDEWLKLRLGSDGDGINAEAVLGALHATIEALKEIDKERSRFGKETIEWRISDAGKNSPFFAEITGRDTVTENGQATEIFKDFANGLKHLQHGNACPQNFNTRSLKHIGDLTKVLPRGINFIQFETAFVEIFATPETTFHAKQAISNLELARAKRGKTYSEYGTIEGRLKGVSEMTSQKRDQFTIVDMLTKHETICYFTGSGLEQKVRDCWKHRVAVSGEISVNRMSKDPESMKVHAIRRLRESNELPQPEDIERLGINITNGVESSEYVRGLRDAE